MFYLFNNCLSVNFPLNCKTKTQHHVHIPLLVIYNDNNDKV